MNHPVEFVSLPAADVLRAVSAQTLAEALLERVKNGPPAVAEVVTPLGVLPRIGEEWNGGIYAGLSIADNTPVALVLLPGDEQMNWKDAVAWAEKQGGTLPSRIDQLVLFKNLKDQFQEAWYWSGETYAPGSVYAWGQIFSNGYQGYDRKDYDYRVRAVRRSVIQ